MALPSALVVTVIVRSSGQPVGVLISKYIFFIIPGACGSKGSEIN